MYKSFNHIFFISIVLNIIIPLYSLAQSDKVILNDSGVCCDSLNGFDIDSLIANPYMLLKEWTSSYTTKEDSIALMKLVDTCNVYKLFIKKEKQIEKYKPMLALYHFPTHSKIIEVKDLKKNGILMRAIVYWIQYPKAYMYIEEDYDCYSSMMGHGHYNGKIKFSLIDTKLHKIINTVDLTYEEEIYEAGTEKTYITKDICLDLPFSSPSRKSEMALSSRVEYKIKGGNETHEGLTEVLYLDDYNGDGCKLEFAVFMASGGCMGTESTLFGYSKIKDKLIQYPIEIKSISNDSTNNEIIENNTTYWLGYTFTLRFKAKKLKYQMDWRGRGGCLSKYDLYFDELKDCFIGIQDNRETELQNGEKASWISLPE